ncbi:hypothetical protein [Winogradskyella sp.]|uniref:hypothetical protein n=2 Tax=Winogradskyella sp. TaxID=1883156 RepID=UPI003516F9F9
MDVTRHCKLCDHQKIDFKTGTYCGLTNRKPEFYGKCVNAKFDSKLDIEISDINIEYESVLKTKWRSYIYSITFLIIGTVALIFGSYLVLNLLAQSEYDYHYTRILGSFSALLTFGSILFIFPIATKYLSHYTNSFKLAKTKKESLDKILNLYGITYNIDITFPKKSSDDDIEVDLKIRR